MFKNFIIVHKFLLYPLCNNLGGEKSKNNKKSENQKYCVIVFLDVAS